MRGGSNREWVKRENQWNNRIVQAAEPRRLPKVPKFRRHNGEEVKGVIFTGAARSKSTSKRNAGSASSLRPQQQQQYHYQQTQYHLKQADYQRQSSMDGKSIPAVGGVEGECETSPVYYANDVQYHRFTDHIQEQQDQQLQIPHILPKSIHDDGDDYDNEGYEEEPQEDAVWDGAVDVARSHQYEDYTALQHQPYQPHYPKPANQSSPLRRSIDSQKHHASEDVKVAGSKLENILDVDNEDVAPVNEGQLIIDIQKHISTPEETPRRGEVNALLGERRGVDKPYLLRKLSHLGRGSSSTVYKTFHSGRFEVVAEKVIICSSETRKVELIRELASLRTLLDCDDARKQYIVGLKDVIGVSQNKALSSPSVSVCLEYMHASLQDVVDSGGCAEELVISGMTRQMLLGLSFIHEKRFLHRDFKPGNVLVNSKGMVKISDLGLCIDLPKGNSLAESFTGTYHYMSPERIEGGSYGYSSDVWGLGMTILACAMGSYPYDDKRGYWALLAAIKDEPVPTPDPSRFSPEFREFISLATRKDPDERATAADLLHHAFIAKGWKDENLVEVSSPRNNQYTNGGSVRESGENDLKHDAMKTSNEWIRTSINSLTRRPDGRNSKKKRNGPLRPTKSANDKPHGEVGRKHSADASSVGRHHHPTNQGQLAGDSVMLTSRGKLMVPDEDGIPCEDSELRMVLKAFKKYLQHVWKDEASYTGQHSKSAQGEDETPIDPLSAVTASSLGTLAAEINHSPTEVRKQFLSLIKSLQTAFVSAIKENEKLHNVLYGPLPTRGESNNVSAMNERMNQLSKPIPSKMAPNAIKIVTNNTQRQQQQYEESKLAAKEDESNSKHKRKETRKKVSQLTKPQKDHVMPKPLQIVKKGQRSKGFENNANNPQPPSQQNSKQSANLRLIRAKALEKKKELHYLAHQTEYVDEDDRDCPHNQLPNKSNIQLEIEANDMGDMVEEGPSTGRQFDDIFQEQPMYDNDIATDINRQTSVVVDQKFYSHTISSHQRLENQGNGTYDYDSEKEREDVEDDPENVFYDENRAEVDGLNDDNEVPIPSGLAVEAEGEGGLSMTYLDEYFDEYAEEFGAEPLPSEAIGLDGVSPEKRRRESRDIGEDDDEQNYENRQESNPEQMLSVELEVDFAKSLTLEENHEQAERNERLYEDDDEYEMDVFDQSREEEVQSLKSPTRALSEPQVIEKEALYTQLAPSERKSAAMERVLDVGQKVQGKYDGGNRWYAGVIAAVNNDGTYDIQYNDGDFESCVISAHIRAVTSNASAVRPQPMIRTVRTLEPAIKKVGPEVSSIARNRASTPKLVRMNSQNEDGYEDYYETYHEQRQENDGEEEIDMKEDLATSISNTSPVLDRANTSMTSPKSHEEYSVDFDDYNDDNAAENMKFSIATRSELTIERTIEQKDHVRYTNLDIDGRENQEYESYREEDAERWRQVEGEEEMGCRRREEAERQSQEEVIREREVQIKIQKRQREIEQKLEKDREEAAKRFERERNIYMNHGEDILNMEANEAVHELSKTLQKQLKEGKKKKARYKQDDNDEDDKSLHHTTQDTFDRTKTKPKRPDEQYEDTQSKAHEGANISIGGGANDEDDLYSFDSPDRDLIAPKNNQDKTDLTKNYDEDRILDDDLFVGDAADDDAQLYEDDFEF